MGKYKNGINGAFSGKIGNIVGASSHGVDYIRSVPDFRIDKPTPAQQKHRAKFGIVSSWFKPLKSVIEIGLQHKKDAKTSMNFAISLNFNRAVVVEGQDPTIDFPKVILSIGELFISVVSEFTSTIKQRVLVEWIDANASLLNNPDDKATFVIYNEQKKKYLTFSEIAVRADKQVILQFPASFSGSRIHCWMQYVSVKGDQVSSTVYVGEIEVL